MVGGRGVRLEPESVLRDGEFFLAIDPRADTRSLNRESRVRIASLIRREWIAKRFRDEVHLEKRARFDEERGRVIGEQRLMYRDLPIEEHEHVAISPEVASHVLADAIRPRAIVFFREQTAASLWLARFNLLKRAMPDLDLPALDETALSDLIDEACRGRRSVEELRTTPWIDLLRGRLTYAQARNLDEQAPEALVVPSGNRITLHYEEDRPPVLAVRLQELFGWTETPRIAGGRVAVVLHLLGPNYRPVQVTDDLGSFWRSTYFQVRKDLRNRYPKHAWPEDPLTAKAEARGGRRRT